MKSFACKMQALPKWLKSWKKLTTAPVSNLPKVAVAAVVVG